MTTESGDRYWYDSDLWQLLSKLEVTDYELIDDSTPIEHEYEGDWRLAFRFEVGPAFVKDTIRKKRDYLAAAYDEEPPIEDVLDAVAADFENSIDITYNTVGLSTPDEGPYEKINDTQWKKRKPESEYSNYNDLLWGLTEGEKMLSVPSLRKTFLEACAESDEHTLPPEAAVKNILLEHFDDVRSENESRKAQSKLKMELEQRGINPRSAVSIAKQMDDLLITDAELEEQLENKEE